MTRTIHFVFDQPPCPEGARFIECETSDGKSVNMGPWLPRADGFWELVVEVAEPGTVCVPREPTAEMAAQGAHCNSEWLNDGAPIGESRYREPAIAVWRSMLRVALGEDPNYGWKEKDV